LQNYIISNRKIKKITEKAKALIEQFDVRTPSEQTLARALSGGNQQKLLISYE
jgi:ABC-type uncharacterized transport system ATPase subunit